MIVVEKLSKFYRQVVAVDDVSFEVKQGEIVGFLGPNGAGKTTAMRIITGFISPTSGSVKIDGQDVFEYPLETKRKIGYLPEQPPVYPELTVFEYLRYVGSVKGLAGAKLHSEIDRVSQLAGTGEVRHRLIANISKGFRQRVGVAQALLGDPPILILDEPTVGLDPAQIHEVRALIKSLAGGHTIILSTHILPEVEMTCRRVMVIHRGRIVAQDSIENIMSTTRSGARIHLQVARPEGLEPKLLSFPGVAKVAPDQQRPGLFVLEGDITETTREELAKLVVQGNHGLLTMADVTQRLEDVFLQLTAKEEHAASAEAPAANLGDAANA